MSASEYHHVTVESEGRVLAAATIHTDADSLAISAELRVEAGHLPPGTGARLVDAVVDEAAAAPGTPVEVTLPAGEAEILDRVRERFDQVQTRSAGASVLAQGAVAGS